MICEILVRVSFLNRTITKKDHGVVEGDYNTTKLVFEFEEDVSDQRVVFKMSNPDGDLILMKDLVDNEVVLAGYDDEGNVYSLFGVAGPHAFELVLYGENSKLTSATGWLAVNKRQVNIGDGNVVEGYLPVLDELLMDVEHMQGKSAYEIWLGEGNTGTEADFLASLKGEKGDKGADGTMSFEDLTEEQKASLKGDKGDKGDPGEPGPQGKQGNTGNPGVAGLSAYEVWLSVGNTGTEADFIASLKGEKGNAGIIAATVTLEADYWYNRDGNGIVYELSFEGVTSDPTKTHVFYSVTPGENDEAMEDEVARCRVRLARQEDNYLWFKAKETPAIDIDMNILVVSV